jgi:hypothetical protein
MDELKTSTGGVEITVRVNSYAFLFGMPALLASIILATVGVTFFVIRPNVMVPNLEVTPKVSVNAQMPAPNFTLESKNPVNVNVPPITLPTINVPPARVTVNVPQAGVPNISVTVPDGKPGEIRTVEKVVEKRVEVSVPVYVETAGLAKVTLEDIFAAAERYLTAWCVKAKKDPQAEAKTWLANWQTRVTERGGDEQRLANETLIEKHTAFDVAKAKPEEVVYVCRILRRYKDGGLALPSVFKEAVTPDVLVKFHDFLEKGTATMN